MGTNGIVDIVTQDREFEDHTIEEVSGDRTEGWTITFDGCTCFHVPNTSPVVPSAGMIARLYGKGLGYVVRGLQINGRTVFYRTEAEEAAYHKAQVEAENQRKRDELQRELPERDARFAALPEIFQRRILKFRGNNPDFRWEFEPYEMFTCEQAVVIAKSIGDAEQVREFVKLPWAEQVARVPELSDQHSGNTFGMACHLAFQYLSEPENVVKLHGALAPLVGSEAYGCVPRTEAAA